MICLDTSYLIMALVPDSREAALLLGWSRSGETFCTPALAWCEFLCGPVRATHVATMRGVVHAIVPFADHQAAAAARLFGGAGRKRRLRVDAMIAATAITQQAPLATGNQEDFLPFVPLGLRIAESV